jgi:hypothetical protein
MCILLFDMAMVTTATQLIVKEFRVDYLGMFPPHMPKSQPQKTTLKRKRAVDILLSGLRRIAADLQSYGTLPDMPNVLPTLPVAPSSSQVHVDCSFILETIFTYASDFRKENAREGTTRIDFL